MLLSEISVKEAPGTFIGIRFDEQTKERIKALIDDLKIKNPINLGDLHTTLVYSANKTIDGFEPQEIDQVATPDQFDIFSGSDGKKCLVIKLNCDYLKNRNKEIVSKYGVVEKWPEYKPHVTLSYDYEGGIPDAKVLKNMTFNIKNEYMEPIREY